MSILGRLFRRGVRADSSASPADDYYYQPSSAGGIAQSGSFVTGDTAMRVAAVYACVRVLAETLAMLPISVYRQTPDGRFPAKDHALWALLSQTPNAMQTAYEFKSMMMAHLALRGNAYAQIVADGAGTITALLPMHPDKMRVYRMNDGSLQYRYINPWTGLTQVLLAADVLHLRGLSMDGIIGLSPVALARETFGGALAAQDWANRMYANNATPGGVLEIPGKIDEASAKRVKTDWQAKFTGMEQHKIAVLDQGAKFTPISITPEDMQFLQTRQFMATDIARIFRVQPHKIGIMDRATHSNIEHQGIEFVQDTMLPWITNWEQAIQRDLMTPQESTTLSVSFDVDALLRGDTPSRYAAYAVGRQWGWLSANDIRKRELMDPIDGGDEYLRPLNMVDATGKPPPPGNAPATPPKPSADPAGDA